MTSPLWGLCRFDPSQPGGRRQSTTARRPCHWSAPRRNQAPPCPPARGTPIACRGPRPAPHALRLPNTPDQRCHAASWAHASGARLSNPSPGRTPRMPEGYVSGRPTLLDELHQLCRWWPCGAPRPTDSFGPFSVASHTAGAAPWLLSRCATCITSATVVAAGAPCFVPTSVPCRTSVPAAAVAGATTAWGCHCPL